MEGWRSESADTVEEVHETGVCEWWEELVVVEWAIVRGYKGCEMGHFVGGGEYIDPLRNTNVECDSKLNNPELAYIALLYSVYTSKLSIKASFELGKLLLNRVNNLYPLSTTIFHGYFYILNINKPIQPHSYVHAQHLQPSLTTFIST